MIMIASTALVTDRMSFLKLRNFTYALNAITHLHARSACFLPPEWTLSRGSSLVFPVMWRISPTTSLIILLPWPGAIGYRRFYQGLLIRSGQTRRVAYGTVVRLLSMSLTGIVLYSAWELPGAYVAAAALTTGVVCEAVAARIMSFRQVQRLLLDENGVMNSLRYRGIAKFYYPPGPYVHHLFGRPSYGVFLRGTGTVSPRIAGRDSRGKQPHLYFSRYGPVVPGSGDCASWRKAGALPIGQKFRRHARFCALPLRSP